LNTGERVGENVSGLTTLRFSNSVEVFSFPTDLWFWALTGRELKILEMYKNIKTITPFIR